MKARDTKRVTRSVDSSPGAVSLVSTVAPHACAMVIALTKMYWNTRPGIVNLPPIATVVEMATPNSGGGDDDTTASTSGRRCRPLMYGIVTSDRGELPALDTIQRCLLNLRGILARRGINCLMISHNNHTNYGASGCLPWPVLEQMIKETLSGLPLKVEIYA